tara:strand:+ start:26 stop:358 length:333 start_codon:yes stop_codon:yes gene_type:complete
MNKPITKTYKAKWITALTSGKYGQTEGFLHDGGNYCAIGVALHACNHIPKEELDSCTTTDDIYLADEYDNIPTELLQNSKLSDTVMKFNDEDNYTFKWIADWIEKNVEAV